MTALFYDIAPLSTDGGLAPTVSTKCPDLDLGSIWLSSAVIAIVKWTPCHYFYDHALPDLICADNDSGDGADEQLQLQGPVTSLDIPCPGPYMQDFLEAKIW